MLSHWDVVVRLGLAVVAGGLIGVERESHGRAAGLRTTLLVCVAAAVAMLLSELLYADAAAGNTSWRPDPARLAQGILAGMGFLGAGAIIKEGNMVRGVTTAAVLWYVTVLGLAFGSGHLLLGIAGWAIALVTLLVLPSVESLVANDWYGVLTVTLEGDGTADEEIRDRVERSGATVKKMDFEEDVRAGTRVVRCELKYKKGDLFALSRDVRGSIRGMPGVVRVRWA